MRVGYSHLGSPLPSRHMVAWVGVEPTNDHQALDLAALPVCVPRRRRSGLASLGFRDEAGRFVYPVAQEGVEPSASLGLSKGGLPVAYRAGSGRRTRTFIAWFKAGQPTISRSPKSCLRSALAGHLANAKRKQVCAAEGEGVEPS